MVAVNFLLAIPENVIPGTRNIRVAGTMDNQLFCLADVCQALELADVHKVAERLADDDRNLIPVIDSLGRTQQATFITESGLYECVFRSDKPFARDFRRWVTGEVLPSIRKHGCYPAPAQPSITNPTSTAALESQLAEVRQQQIALERRESILSRAVRASRSLDSALIDLASADTPQVPCDSHVVSGQVQTAILDYLRRIAPGAARNVDIASACNLKEDSVRTATRRMHDSGILARDHLGYWVPEAPAHRRISLGDFN